MYFKFYKLFKVVLGYEGFSVIKSNLPVAVAVGYGVVGAVFDMRAVIRLGHTTLAQPLPVPRVARPSALLINTLGQINLIMKNKTR